MLASVLWRSLNFVHRRKRGAAIDWLHAYDNRLPATIYVQKAVCVLKLLERYKPKSICELGSGESSGWFAAYHAKNPDVVITSIDEWQKWQDETTIVAKDIGGVSFFVSRKIEDKAWGGYGYECALPDAEFIFVDGPHHETQFAGTDVLRHLSMGYRPKVICVDGRTTGVDAIRKLTEGEYKFYPQMIWCFERNELRSALAMNGQSVFVRELQ